MKKTARILICLMLAICICMGIPAGASADNGDLFVPFEQCRIFAPEVDMVLYPMDSNINLIYGLNGNNMSAEATLDGEPLTLKSISRTEGIGCSYIVMVDVSYRDVNYDHLQLIKKDLMEWIDGLNENDRFILVSYAKEPTILLDGSEKRDAAKKLVESLDRDNSDANYVKALEEGIRIGGLPENDNMKRRVLVMIDPGKIHEVSGDEFKAVTAKCVEADMPVFSICSTTDELTYFDAAAFSTVTGGWSFNPVSGKNTCITELRNRLDNGYLLSFTGNSNHPEPESRTLNLKITLSDGRYFENDYSVKVRGHIPDSTAPVAEAEISEDRTELTVRFSENVTGAQSAGNYRFAGAKKDNEIKVKSVNYDSQTLTSTLIFDAPVDDGRYTLTFKNITDTSAEANPVVYPDGKDCLEVTVGDAEGLPLWLILTLAAVVLIALAGVAAAVIVYRKKTAPEPALPVQLTIVSKDGQKFYRQVAVGKSFTIGRAADKVDLALQGDPKISRCHLQLSFDGKALTAVDTGSQNGSMVNGTSIEKQRMLNSGDTITIGNTQISVMF